MFPITTRTPNKLGKILSMPFIFLGGCFYLIGTIILMVAVIVSIPFSKKEIV